MFYITHLKPDRTTYTSAHSEKPNNLHNITYENQTLDFLRLAKMSDKLDRSWRTFQIPKASGGMRTITAPSEDLKEQQKSIVYLLKNKYKILESTWSFAYIQDKSTTHALEKHTDNRSVWFLKLDIKDFFSSITAPLISNTLDTVYPTCTFKPDERAELLDLISHFCLHEHKTPQGAVSSPLISNWVMVPFLYKIHKKINELARDNLFPQIPKQKYVMTCYADDLVISAKQQFNWKQLQDAIAETLQPYFQLKLEKTHYGNNAGRNHILGKVLNKNNNITPGYRKIKQWKHQFLAFCNQINGNTSELSKAERQAIYGRLSWDFNTSMDYLRYLLNKYETKYTRGNSITTYLTKA